MVLGELNFNLSFWVGKRQDNVKLPVQLGGVTKGLISLEISILPQEEVKGTSIDPALFADGIVPRESVAIRRPPIVEETKNQYEIDQETEESLNQLIS
jgi:hypothetical protein